MKNFIALKKYPIKNCLDILLKDNYTNKNIVFQLDKDNDSKNNNITIERLLNANSDNIYLRSQKNLNKQIGRSKQFSEVYTPSWVCNKMINYYDNEWFGYADVFNNEKSNSWITNNNPILFKNKDWKTYVSRKLLEITCGEAPFLVSRYDAVTGQSIDINDRIGLLDRKLRVINENTNNPEEWFEQTELAYNTTYGFEKLGDSLLLARINLLLTFYEYYVEKWGQNPDNNSINSIARIISSNIVQVDILVNAELIKNLYRNNKFDLAIGGPPFSIKDKLGNSMVAYNLFYDLAIESSNIVELLTPARYLFDIGNTPSEWNKKILSSKHFKVLYYWKNSNTVYDIPNIIGGLAIGYYNHNSNFEPIEIYTEFSQIKGLWKKVNLISKSKLIDVISDKGVYEFSDLAFKKFPDKLVNIRDSYINATAFKQITEIFLVKNPQDENDYIKVLGHEDSNVVYRWINSLYCNKVKNLNSYKIALPKIFGSGKYGEVIPEPIILQPNTSFSTTFIVITKLNNIDQAKNCVKYIKTKFVRALLGIAKNSLNNPKEVWKHIPLQDFTDNSDIDWMQPVKGIDKQLYKKYGLTLEESSFLENNIQDMDSYI